MEAGERAHASFLTNYTSEVARGLGELLRGDPPTIVRVDRDLVLRSLGGCWRRPVLDRAFDELMHACHVPAMMALGNGALTSSRQRLQLRAHAFEMLDSAREPATRALLTACVERLRASEPSPWSTFADAIRSPVQRCIARAAEIECGLLHAATVAFLDSVDERASAVHFVICGGHQPRYRELTKRYFAALAGEPVAAGARRERRVLYAENRSEIDALRLLAAQLVDRRLADRLWGDERMMQEDLLGHAAGDAIEALGLPVRPATDDV